MRIVIPFLVFFASYCLQAQPPIQWQKAYGGTGFEQASKIIQTTDGGYLICGGSGTADGDITVNQVLVDFWAIRTDASGTILWQRSLGGSGVDFGIAARQTSDNGFLILGFSYSSDGDMQIDAHAQVDVFLFKLTESGNISWQKTFGSSGDDFIYGFEQTIDGGYILAGDTGGADGNVNSPNKGSQDCWFLKLDATGEILWSKTYGGFDFERVYSVKPTVDGGYIAAGYTRSNDGDVSGNHGGTDIWVLKLDTLGELQWKTCYGSTDNDIAFDIQTTTDSGYLVTGFHDMANGDVSDSLGARDCWLFKIDASGTILWQKTLGGTGIDEGKQIRQTADGGYLLLAHTNSNDTDVSSNHGDQDIWLVKLDSTRSIAWQRALGGTSYDEANDLLVTADGAALVLGQVDSADGDVSGVHGFTDIWLARFDNLLATSTSEVRDTALVYPNPFDGELSVRLGAGNQNSRFTIRDLLGKELLSGKMTNDMPIDTSQLTTGIYLLQLEGFKKAIKLIKK